MPKYILTDNTRGSNGIFVKGVLGDYVAPSYTPLKVVTNGQTSKKTSSEETTNPPTSQTNTPSDDRVVSANSDALKNFDSTKIYEGLVSYNKEDKNLYIWKGEVNTDGTYVWEKVTSESETATENNQPQDSRFITADGDALKNFDSDEIYEGLITYNKADQTLYVWKGEVDTDGTYIWEAVDTATAASDSEELTDTQLDELKSELLKIYPSSSNDTPAGT